MNGFNIEDKNKLEEILLKYEFALEMLETELDILIKGYVFKNKYNPVEHVKSRIKSQDSAIKKLQNKNYEITIDNLVNHVHDMIGVRIVCSFLTDVYEIVSLIKDSNQFKIKEEKDYIAKPKDTGYISYHLIIEVPIVIDNKTEYVEAEIQIRTIAMDFWASLDHKIQYKFKEIPEEIKNEMYKCSLDIEALDEKMNELKKFVNNYNHE